MTTNLPIQGCDNSVLLGSVHLLQTQALQIIKMRNHRDSEGKSHEILHMLHHNGYVILKDMFDERPFYRGKNDDVIFDLDKTFGSQKFNIPGDEDIRVKFAQDVLKAKIDHEAVGGAGSFQDIIAIARPLYEQMCAHFFPGENQGSRALRGNETSSF